MHCCLPDALTPTSSGQLKHFSLVNQDTGLKWGPYEEKVLVGDCGEFPGPRKQKGVSQDDALRCLAYLAHPAPPSFSRELWV